MLQSLVLLTLIHLSSQIYVPAHSIEISHNYSKVSHQNRPHPVSDVRQIVRYNKTKRTPKPETYRTCPPDASGQFVYESSCNQFLNCWKGRGYVQNCAPGTLFNPQSLECDFPEKVACISGPRQISVPQKRNVQQIGCPEHFTGLIPNYTDCSRFINCVSGIENFMECPPGTLFNMDTNVCDFPQRAVCFNGNKQAQSFANLKYRSAEIRCPEGALGVQKHPYDCSKFLNCANGQTFVQDCAPGTLFNPNLRICDFPYNVRCDNDIGNTEQYPEYTGQINRHDNGQYGNPAPCTGQYGCGSDTQKPTNQYESCSGCHNRRPYSKGTNQYVTPAYNFEPTPAYHFNQTFGTISTPVYNHNPTYGHNYNPYQIQPNLYGTNQYDQQPYGHNLGTNQYGQNAHFRPVVHTDPGQYEHIQKPNQYNGHFRPHGTGETNQYGSQLPNSYDQGHFRPYGTPEHTPISPYPNVQTGHLRPFPETRPCTGYDCQNSGSLRPTNQYGPNIQSYDQATTRPNLRPYGTQCTGYNCQNNGPLRPISYDETTPYNGQVRPYVNGHGTRPYNQNGGVQCTSSDCQAPNYGQAVRPYVNHHETRPYGQNSGVQCTSSNCQTPNKDQVVRPYVHATRPYDQNGGVQCTGSDCQAPNYGQPVRPYVNPHETRPYDQNGGVPCTRSDCQAPNYDQEVRPYVKGDETRPHVQNGNVQCTGSNCQTPNYDQVVNINQRPSNSFRNPYEPFYGTKGDQDDVYVPGYSQKVVASTPRSRQWPPAFPSTESVNIYEPERENELDQDTGCRRNEFSCTSHKCISKELVCNSVKDCLNGQDETNCGKYVSKFTMTKNHKLAVMEKERWENVSEPACALLCIENRRFICRAFNFRKIDKTCFLTDSNEALSGALIAYYPFDYYEHHDHKIDCADMFRCPNKKCISRQMICNGNDDCGDRSDEKNCNPQDFGYSVRLLGSTNKNEGQIWVSAMGKNGFVCDDNFGQRAADVVCRELGFSLGAVEVKKNGYFSGNETGESVFYIMDDVDCQGNESRLMDCDFNGWGVHNCLKGEMVGVVCKTNHEKCPSDYWQCESGSECLPLAFLCDGLLDCSDGSDERSQHCDAPTEIRLANGQNRKEGRVEVLHHGVWGTICDDDFNEDAAKVICKHLGYKGSAIVKKESYFGTGSGPIWLDQVFCSGNETNIDHCSHWNWGEHNCDHNEDVGIVCSDGYEFEERHFKLAKQTEIFPNRCGYQNDQIFNRGDDVHFRVVQGSRAKIGDYPWQAAIRVKTHTTPTHWCGAVVISAHFVLTAAHCLLGYAKGAYVIVAGDYDVDEAEGTEQEARIEDFYIHENFKQGHKMNNDIALVKLKGDGFRLDGSVAAICLPDSDVSYETNLNCTISGFGSIESGKSAFSHVLRAGWVPLQRKEICKMPHVYGDALTEGMFCAGSLDEGVDACDGDSGGPLACLHQGLFTLYGITSWGQRCGYANKPGVYVKVAHYKKWIDEHLKKYS